MITSNEAARSEQVVEVHPTAKTVARCLREAAGIVEAVGRQGLEPLRSAGAECMAQGRELAESCRHRAEDAVRSRPFVSVLVTAGIATALGFGLAHVVCRHCRVPAND